MPDQLADVCVHHEVRSTHTDLDGLVCDIRSDEVVYGDTILTRQYLSHRGAVANVVLDENDRGLAAAATDFRPTGEEVNIERRWVPLDDAVTAILERKTQNGTLAVAVLAAFAAKARGWTNATRADTPWDRHPSASLHQ